MTRIALLTPTRGRPEQFKRMVESVKNTSENAQVYVAASTEDINYCSGHWYQLITPDGMPTVHKWNMLAQQAMSDPEVKLFMLCADDVVFSAPGWDKALIDHYSALPEGRKQHVYSFQDSRDAEGTPHPIVTRDYIDSMGYFLPPIFMHWYVDAWTNDIARSNNCFTHLKEYLLLHDKPSDRGMGDDTYQRIRRAGWRERDAYVNETCGHFLELEKQRLAKALRIGYQEWTIFKGASQQ